MLGIVEKTHRMDVAGVAAVGELRLEAPVELVARITEHAFGCDDDLVQKQFVGPIGKKVAEV